MKLIDPSVEIITPLNGKEILQHIELAIRNCYKSEDKTTDDSYLRLVKTILDSHHYSTIEHFNITFRVICSRACMAQWTRHRHMSYSIESQRYICYTKDKFGGEITFIKSPEFDKYPEGIQQSILGAFKACEIDYLILVEDGLKAQEARQVLNNAVKTEMVVTANLRTLREFLKLRTSKSAQSEIRMLATQLLEQLRAEIPVVFDNLES
jgi:thymidylate synthase (FAD)